MEIKKNAFSLVELLVGLIIISLLVTAFIPLITKKLKASDITVGSFGSSENNSQAKNERNVTKEDCDKYNAVYIPKGIGVPKPLCVMKRNIGDGFYNDNWEGVQLCKTSESCTVNGSTKDDLTPTCRQGSTANPCNNKHGGGYSGCTRTVCNWTGGNKMCENIGWRLPDINELDAFLNKTYTNETLGSSGLMLCVDGCTNTTEGPACCNVLGCDGTFDGRCYPNGLYSNSFVNKTQVHHKYISCAEWTIGEAYLNSAISIRCVLDSIKETKTCQKGYHLDKDTNECIADCQCENGSCEEGSTTCTGCNDGYFLFNNKCVTTVKPTSQADCDKYSEKSVFISSTYLGSLNGGICVTKYNVGDTSLGGPAIPSKYYTNGWVIGVGSKCLSDGNCCWTGGTSTNSEISACTSSRNGNYSGCNRTVCQFNPANDACKNYAPNGMPKGYWRLPKYGEVLEWGNNLNAITTNKGVDGLMLCDVCESKVPTGTDCCAWSTKCVGALGGPSTNPEVFNRCYPYILWTETEGTSPSFHNVFIMQNGLAVFDQGLPRYTYSVRCVYDGTRYWDESGNRIAN